MRKPINTTDREIRLSKSDKRFPYYGATGQVGFIDEYLCDFEAVLLGEDAAPFLDKYKNKAYLVSGKYWVNNHAHILKAKENITSNRFICHYLNTINYSPYVRGGTRLKLNQSIMKQIPIPIPPLQEQKRIVEFLDSFSNLISNLISELDLRKLQYSYYRNKLLSFDESVERKELGEVAYISTGGNKPKNFSDVKTNDYNVPVYANATKNNGLNGWTDIASINKPAITISARGSKIGFVCVRDNPYLPIISLISIIPKTDIINLRFLAHVLKNTNFKRRTTGGAIPQLNIKNIKDIKIPIPPLQKQKEIVSILDEFENLTNNFKKGIPREIELRKQQLSYYRDKILKQEIRV